MSAQALERLQINAANQRAVWRVRTAQVRTESSKTESHSFDFRPELICWNHVHFALQGWLSDRAEDGTALLEELVEERKTISTISWNC
jgi:hypothetical protein